MRTKITFFDIPTCLSVPTSPNTWKVRLVLNFKRLHHDTHWVPSSDIESVCKSMGIPPTGIKPSGEPHYTLPAIIDYTRSSSQPVILSDSTPIVRYLEHTYPTPTRELFPPDREQEYMMFEDFLRVNIMKYSLPLWIVDVYNAKIPSDREPFRKRMEEMFGKRMEDVKLQGPERENVWKSIEQAFRELSEYFPGGKDGEFLTGDQVSFPDFTLCGCLASIKTLSPTESWTRIAAWEEGRWERFFQAFENWMSVDQHPIIEM